MKEKECSIHDVHVKSTHGFLKKFSIFTFAFDIILHTLEKNVNKKMDKICWIAKNNFNIV